MGSANTTCSFASATSISLFSTPYAAGGFASRSGVAAAASLAVAEGESISSTNPLNIPFPTSNNIIWMNMNICPYIYRAVNISSNARPPYFVLGERQLSWFFWKKKTSVYFSQQKKEFSFCRDSWHETVQIVLWVTCHLCVILFCYVCVNLLA